MLTGLRLLQFGLAAGYGRYLVWYSLVFEKIIDRDNTGDLEPFTALMSVDGVFVLPAGAL